MRKLAVIRDNTDDLCPYGLTVSWSCKHAGDTVKRMFPIDSAKPEEKDGVIKANKRLLVWSVMAGDKEPQQCIYAENLFPDKEGKVDCSHGDSAAGEKDGATLVGYPQYTESFDGAGMEGLFATPGSYMMDGNLMRNTYYGVLSLQGGEKSEKELISLANDILGQETKMITKEEAQKAKDCLSQILDKPEWLRGIGLSCDENGSWLVSVNVDKIDSTVRYSLPVKVNDVPVAIHPVGNITAY